jgi:hypothetical protein
MKHCGFDRERFAGGRSIGSVGDAYMIGPMTRHESVPRYAVENRAY